jgi:hypothetical protein
MQVFCCNRCAYAFSGFVQVRISETPMNRPFRFSRVPILAVYCTMQVIMHRFTQRSRRLILERFPGTTLAMDTRDRIHKGFGKYVYEPQKAQELEGVLRSYIYERFPHAQIEYFT